MKNLYPIVLFWQGILLDRSDCHQDLCFPRLKNNFIERILMDWLLQVYYPRREKFHQNSNKSLEKLFSWMRFDDQLVLQADLASTVQENCVRRNCVVTQSQPLQCSQCGQYPGRDKPRHLCSVSPDSISKVETLLVCFNHSFQ